MCDTWQLFIRRVFLKALGKSAEISGASAQPHSVQEPFSMSRRSDWSLLKPPTSPVTRFNQSLTPPPSSATKPKCQTHHRSSTRTTLVLTVGENGPFPRWCCSFHHTITHPRVYRTLFAVIKHRYHPCPAGRVQLYF